MIRVEIHICSYKSPVNSKLNKYIVFQHDFVTNDEAKFVGNQFKEKGFIVLYFDISSKQIYL